MRYGLICLCQTGRIQTLLSPKDARDVIESEKLSHNDLISYIPDATTNSEEKRRIKEAATRYINLKTKQDYLRRYKSTGCCSCDSCGAKHTVGQKGGPTKRQLENSVLLVVTYVESRWVKDRGS